MKQFLRYSIVTGLFVIPFLAFLVSGSMLFPYITGKNFAFRIITEIIFVFWAILALKDAAYAPKKSWILYVYGAFILFMGLADLIGASPGKSFWSNFERMEGFVTHIHLFLYFVVLSTMAGAEKLWNRFLGVWIGVGAIMSFLGVRQLLDQVRENIIGRRIDATFGNATYLAAFLLFTSFFTLLFIVRYIRDKNKLIFLIPVFLLQTWVLYLTATRGAILGFLGGIFLVAVLIALGEREYRSLRKVGIGLVLGLVLLVGGFLLAKDTQFVRESPVLERFASLSLDTIKTQGRYYIWPIAIQGIQEKPIFGWGQENFNYVFNSNYNPAMWAQEQWFDRAHNIVLDWLIAGGLLAFIPYAGLFVLFLWYLWKKSNLSFAEKSIWTGLFAAYVFQGVFVFDNLFSFILFFSMLAYMHSLAGKTITVPAWLSGPTVRSGVSACLILIVLFTLYAGSIKPIQASQSLISALQQTAANDLDGGLDSFDKVFEYDTFGNAEAREQLVSAGGAFLGTNASSEVKTRYAELAKKQLDLHVKEYPNDARARLFNGILLRNLGFSELAVLELEKAAELSPNKQTILFELGAALVTKRDVQGGYSVFKQAYELAPESPDAKVIYLIGAIYARDAATANMLQSSMPTSTLIFDERISGALASTGQYGELAQVFEKRLLTEQGRGNPQNYISLALVYVELGQRQRAIDLLQTFAKNNPNYAPQIEAYIQQISS